MLAFAGGVNPERVEKALGLVEQSVASRPGDLDEQRLRAVLLSMRYSRRKESIRAFESMDEARRLGPREQFLLAMLYSSVRDWPRCRAEMLKILDSQPRQPRHMIFYVNLMIQLGELDEAERWLRILKPLIPAEEARVAAGTGGQAAQVPQAGAGSHRADPKSCRTATRTTCSPRPSSSSDSAWRGSPRRLTEPIWPGTSSSRSGSSP